MALASPYCNAKRKIAIMIKNQNVNRVFNDLEAFNPFCVEYGLVFNEADLYRKGAHAYAQFERVKRGEKIPYNWEHDLKLLEEKIYGTVQ